MVGDIYVNVSWRIPQWFQARIFVVNLAPLPIAMSDGQWRARCCTTSTCSAAGDASHP
jgi:hypothetical protein